MKKIILAALAAVVVAGGIFGVNSTYAAVEGTGAGTSITSEQAALPGAKEKSKKRFLFMKDFQQELHRRNDLRIDRLEVKQQMVEKKDQLLDLILETGQPGDKAEDLKEVKQQIQSVNHDLKGLHKLIKVEKAEFIKLVKYRKVEMAHHKANQLLLLGEKVNEKLQEKAGLLDQMIDILSE